jgi:hypothetical protein
MEIKGNEYGNYRKEDIVNKVLFFIKPQTILNRDAHETE